MNKIKAFVAWLRWLLFLPAAALCAWLSWAAIVFGKTYFMGMTGIILDSPVINTGFSAAGSAALGAVFLWVGIAVAPAGRKNLARILGGAVLLVAAAAGAVALLRGRYGNLADVIAMVAGAVAVNFCFAKQGKQGRDGAGQPFMNRNKKGETS